MCGRHYSTYSDEELYFRYLNRRWPWKIHEDRPTCTPNYNTCPTHTAPVLSVYEDKLCIRTMRWGLVPAWAKSVKEADKYSMINAKIEEIAEKRSYKAAYQQRRCIVPVSGFFEWKRESKSKRPFAIALKGEPIMSLAGIWESWKGEGSDETLLSYSVLTTAANSRMAAVHTRMPVILSKDNEEKWLNPLIREPTEISPLVESAVAETLELLEVSTLVNSPKNNTAEVLAALDQPLAPVSF